MGSAAGDRIGEFTCERAFWVLKSLVHKLHLCRISELNIYSSKSS